MLTADAARRSSRVTGQENGEQLFAIAWQHAMTAFARIDVDGRILGANPCACALLGAAEPALRKRTLLQLTHPEGGACDEALLKRMHTGELDFYEAERRISRADGLALPVRVGVSAVRGPAGALQSFLVQIQDLSALRESEAARKAARMLALDEARHRLTNTLQTLSGLLHLTAESRPIEAGSPIERAQERIRTVALVHEVARVTGAELGVDLKLLLTRILDMQVSSHHPDDCALQIELDLEPHVLALDRALPLGLLAGELLSNALLHAFPGRRHGTLTVSGRAVDGLITLRFADDGIGLPDGCSLETARSLGFRLVRGFAGQLAATVHASHSAPTAITVTFPQMPED